MSMDKIHQLVNSLAKSLENSQKVATPILAAKLAKYAEDYPHDQTIGSILRVVEKMAENNTLFITRAELNKLYSQLYSRNTKFADLFQEEMGVVADLPTPKIYERDSTETVIDSYESADPVLANALNSVFDKTVPLKMYSQAVGDQARKNVASTLDSWNLRPSNIEISEGNDKFLVIKADYETPKGVTSFYVPVETNKNKVLEASAFIGNTGPQDLNYTTIKSYLTSCAGHKLKINASGILQALTQAASENRGVSDTELALIKLNANRNKSSEFEQNHILGQKVAEAAVKDVETPKYDESFSFEKKFASPQGLAEFHLGAATVNTAREHVAREIRGFGFKNPQVVVQGFDNSTIYLNVSLNAGRLGFAVPVRVADGKISRPAVLLCNGAIDSFSQEAIERLIERNASDYKAAAVASPQFSLKPSELLNNIRQAVQEGNHAKAEDALNILANSGDEKAYALGFQTYLSGLSNKVTTANENKCSMVVKNSSSQHPICGHTGLPLHKVHQDKYGNCIPAYRKNMDETYEGASFMNAKIFE